MQARVRPPRQPPRKDRPAARHKYCRNTARLVNALQTATSLSNRGKQWPLRHTQADTDIGSTAQTLPSRGVQHQLWRATTKYTIGLTQCMWPHVRSNRSRLSAGYTVIRLHRAKKTHEQVGSVVMASRPWSARKHCLWSYRSPPKRPAVRDHGVVATGLAPGTAPAGAAR